MFRPFLIISKVVLVYKGTIYFDFFASSIYKNKNLLISFQLFVALATVSAIAVAVPEAEAHGYYYPYYYGHGTLLSPPSIANIDYGKKIFFHTA